MKVCFLINDLGLSGGVGVILRHAYQLSDHGIDVTLAVTRPVSDEWRYSHRAKLRINQFDELRDESFDIAIATWWKTCYQLFDLNARHYAYFLQSLEDRFYTPDNSDRVFAAITHSLPLSIITEAKWIQETITELRGSENCYYVRNGIDKAVFHSPAQITPSFGQPLRVLVEGHPDVWFKGVPEACRVLTQMREPYSATLVTQSQPKTIPDGVHQVIGPLSPETLSEVYRNTDVLLKLSRIEGVYNPPLEAFHLGATCVTTPVTGHDEYIIDGFNGIVVHWDDLAGTARTLDILARNRRYLHNLRSNALLTARGWPSWEQSTEFMAASIRMIYQGDTPVSERSLGRLMREIDVGVREFARHSPNSYPALRDVNDELNAQISAQSAEIARLKQFKGLRAKTLLTAGLRRAAGHPILRPFAKAIRALVSPMRTIKHLKSP